MMRPRAGLAAEASTEVRPEASTGASTAADGRTSVEATGAPSPGQSTSKLHSLTGLRFIAAFLVVLCHVGINLLPNVAKDQVFVLHVFYGFGSVGVSFFFILSGFVLTWVARRTDTVPQFWRRRFFKIYPNHLVMFVAAIILAVTAAHALSTRDTLATLFLVHAWIPDQQLLFNLWSNTPTWSLSCELLFYLAFPFVLTLLRKVRPERLWRGFWLTFAAICAVPFIALLLPSGGELHRGTGLPWLHMWFMTFFPPVRMLEFVLGIFTALIVINGRWKKWPMPVAVIVAFVALIAAGGATPPILGFVAVSALPLALLVGATATADINGRGTSFGSRAMVFLGEISFALYLVHWLVVAYGWIGRHSPTWGADPADAPTTWGTVLAYSGLTIVTSLVLAWLLYTLVERPIMRHWSRPAAKRETPEAVGADRG
ncbi:acyltransferase [Dactylosporangium sp. NPDC005555]|uniref:acyltransferase family protein n=1 Tax=Dactylosporangium sp. NPDC005555 TaxID=3154889 RepID=UPI0033A884BC